MDVGFESTPHAAKHRLQREGQQAVQVVTPDGGQLLARRGPLVLADLDRQLHAVRNNVVPVLQGATSLLDRVPMAGEEQRCYMCSGSDYATLLYASRQAFSDDL